jgi:hypothetical protein
MTWAVLRIATQDRNLTGSLFLLFQPSRNYSADCRIVQAQESSQFDLAVTTLADRFLD